MLASWMWVCALVAQASPSEGLKDMQEDKAKLAIMTLAAQGVPPEFAAGITESIATGIARTGVFATISPTQVTSILAYEKRKEALGGCVEDACYAGVARAVKADFLVSGAVSKVGEKILLNVVLIDATTGATANRAQHEASDPSELVEAAFRTVVVALQPLLAKEQGYLKVTANVPDAALVVNDERRPEGIGQAVELAAGPHVLRVTKDGFYSATADINIQPGTVTNTRLSLIPAKETIEAYETRATLMRVGAWSSLALSAGAIVLSAIMFDQASQDAGRVEDFAALPDIERTAAARERAVSAKSDFEVEQGLYLGGLGGAVLFGGTALYLFLAGDDPDRYAEFRDLDVQ